MGGAPFFSAGVQEVWAETRAESLPTAGSVLNALDERGFWALSPYNVALALTWDGALFFTSKAGSIGKRPARHPPPTLVPSHLGRPASGSRCGGTWLRRRHFH